MVAYQDSFAWYLHLDYVNFTLVH